MKAALICVFVCFTSIAVAQPDAIPPWQEKYALETVRLSEQIQDSESLSAARFALVFQLLRTGLSDQAYDLAMKLAGDNPHRCMLTLQAVAKNAEKRGDEAFAEKCFKKCVEVGSAKEDMYAYVWVKQAFTSKRPLLEIIEHAKQVSPKRRDRVFGDIRDWLARTGQVDKAYEVAREYLSHQKLQHHHRQIGYACASVRHYIPEATHDYIGDTISVINRMTAGKERDFVTQKLVESLVYVTGRNKLPQERLEQAKLWVVKIDSPVLRGDAERKIVRSSGKASIENLEKKCNETELREPKLELLAQLFRELISQNRLEEADAVLDRQLQVIKDQPRDPQVSAFGVFDDQKAIASAQLMHHRTMIKAYLEAEQPDKAEQHFAKLETVSPTEILLVGDSDSIRVSMLIRLGRFDEAKAIYTNKYPKQPDRFAMTMTSHLLDENNLDKAYEVFGEVLSSSPDVVFPGRSVPYASANVHQRLAFALLKADRLKDAVRVLAHIPAHERLNQSFEGLGRSFGEEFAASNAPSPASKQILTKLPHIPAKVHFRIGYLQAHQQNTN